MAKGKKGSDPLGALAAERARIEAQLAALAAREKAAREVARDAGRGVLLAALERVKIPALERDQAAAIAKAIATLGGAEVARRLGSAVEAKPLVISATDRAGGGDA